MVRKAFFKVLKEYVKDNLHYLLLWIVGIVSILWCTIAIGHFGYDISRPTDCTQSQIDAFISLGKDMEQVYYNSANKHEVESQNISIIFSSVGNTSNTITYDCSTQKITQAENSKIMQCFTTFLFAVMGICVGAFITVFFWIFEALVITIYSQIKMFKKNFEYDIDREVKRMISLEESKKVR